MAATVTAAVVVTALALPGCGSNRQRALHPTATTTTTTAPPESTTRADAGPYEWTRDASAAVAIGGGPSSTLAAVVSPTGGSPWIVAGTRTAQDGTSTATVWTSTDGGSWTAAALAGPLVDSRAEAAATWRTQTVIVGSVGQGSQRRAAVWISPAPGAEFVEIAADDLPVEESEMTSIAGGPLGFFAAGTASGRVAMWYSNNGQHWTSLNGADRVFAGADDPHVETLLSTDNGIFAAGWDRSGPSIVAAIWTSGDGVTWRPIRSAQTAFGGPGDHLISALAPLGTGLNPPVNGLVAVGASRTGAHWAPTSWISPNGASWSEPSTAFALGARPQPDATEAVVRALSVVATTLQSSTLVAVGGGPTAQRIWKSTDGLHWAEMALPTGATISDDWRASLLGVSGSTTLVADSDPGQPHLLVQRGTRWQEPSADPVPFGAVQSVAQPAGLVTSPAGLVLAVDVDHPGQTLGRRSASVEFLTSGDGSTWAPVAGGAVFAGGTVDGLAATSTGLVAVGWRRGSGGARAAAWTSPDGRTWRPAVALDTGPVTGSDLATAVCVSGSTVVAVGSVLSARGAILARAWVAGSSGHWVAVPVTADRPLTAAVMSGCAAATTTPGASSTSGATTSAPGSASRPVPPPGFDAFGFAALPSADLVPAFWTSAQGTRWTRQTSSPFGGNFPFPAIDLARTTQVWVAVAGRSEPDLAWPGTGSIVPAPQAGLWRSTDAGTTWQRLDTTGAQWQGDQPAQIDRVAVLGTSPVVAGQVDGRLAIWVGTPT
jgi:hypothetical protein